jgi:hypothetical protein
MPTRRLLVAFAAAALALAGLMPAAALAADGPDVTGTVVLADGTPMSGVGISVTIAGNDMVWSATSGADGAWSVTTGVQPGQTLKVSALRIDYASPDPGGCQSTLGFMGSADVTVDALPLAPVVITIAPGPSGAICGATATPRVGPTPPPTDAVAPAQAGRGADVVLLGLGLAAALLLVVGPVRGAARRR